MTERTTENEMQPESRRWAASRLLLSRCSLYLARVEESLLASAILLIAVLQIGNIFCRTVLGFSLAIAEELTQFCIIAVCFIGLSYAAAKGRHIRMTAIYDQLNQRWRKVLMLLITGFTGLILLVLTYYAAVYVVTVYQLGGIYPASRVPFFLVYCVAPIGLGLSALQFILAAVQNMLESEVYISAEVKDGYAAAVEQEI
jgi:C4-dicarboxylate transporter, DctQ subunit